MFNSNRECSFTVECSNNNYTSSNRYYLYQIYKISEFCKCFLLILQELLLIIIFIKGEILKVYYIKE